PASKGVLAAAKSPAKEPAKKISIPVNDPEKLGKDPERREEIAKMPERRDEKKPPPHTPPLPNRQEPKKPDPATKPSKVVIPEMKKKTVRKYEPEFTKSVLDTPQEEQTGPTMRYSDAELGEFRELINRKLDAAKKELTYLQGLITRKDEMGGDNDDARYMTMEDGSMSMEREQL